MLPRPHTKRCWWSFNPSWFPMDLRRWIHTLTLVSLLGVLQGRSAGGKPMCALGTCWDTQGITRANITSDHFYAQLFARPNSIAKRLAWHLCLQLICRYNAYQNEHNRKYMSFNAHIYFWIPSQNLVLLSLWHCIRASSIFVLRECLEIFPYKSLSFNLVSPRIVSVIRLYLWLAQFPPSRSSCGILRSMRVFFSVGN